jgi:hypothetical protein
MRLSQKERVKKKKLVKKERRLNAVGQARSWDVPKFLVLVGMV